MAKNKNLGKVTMYQMSDKAQNGQSAAKHLKCSCTMVKVQRAYGSRLNLFKEVICVMDTGEIYCITCTVNGKRYYGQAQRKVEKTRDGCSKGVH